MKPKLCPVCSGVGFVPAGLYTFIQTGTIDEMFDQNDAIAICRTCNGLGIDISGIDDKLRVGFMRENQI